MDRFSIIQKQLFNQDVVEDVNSCGLEQCECNEDTVNKKQQLRKTDIAFFVIVIALAFLTAFGFVNKTNASNANLFVKRYTSISCFSKIGNTGKLLDKKLPGDKNNENNCLHQQASLCETNSSKRKFLKTHNCLT